MAYFTASCDTAEDNKKFAEKLELDYPILSDPGRKVAEAFGVVSAKQKNPARWTFYIKNGKIAHIDKKVNTADHGKDVAAKLKDLGATEK